MRDIIHAAAYICGSLIDCFRPISFSKYSCRCFRRLHIKNRPGLCSGYRSICPEGLSWPQAHYPNKRARFNYHKGKFTKQQ